MMTCHRAWITVAIALGCTLVGCKDDPSTGMDAGSEPTESTTQPTTQPATQPTSGDGTESRGDATGSDDAPSGAETDDPVPPGDQIYEEQFEGPDGSPWPDPWAVVGTELISAELDGGRARFNGNAMNVARMVLPGFSETDVDVAFTVYYEDYYAQGVGFYARQNGGALQQTNPAGEGYAVYVEGGFMQNFGIWRETGGVEEPLFETTIASMPPEDDTPYRIRFQCFSQGDQTRLRGRIWPAGAAEPAEWLADIVDDTPQLQGAAGSFAADIYNYSGTASVYIDDVVISRLLPD